MNKILVLFLCLLACSCATRYQANSDFGGYKDFQLDSDVYVVTFEGNRFSTWEEIYKFALRRAAELTKEKGGRYFTTIDNNSKINQNFKNAAAAVSQNMTEDEYHQTAREKISYITFRVLKQRAPGCFDADIILENFKKK